jgi:2'-5' RNA ligase
MRSQIEAFRARWGHPHHNVEPHATVKAPFPWDGDPEQLLTPVRSACAALAPFPARLGAPARFGGAGVLYLTVDSPGLHQLHLAVLEALSGLLPPRDDAHEGEGYTPHLTLAVGRFGISPEAMDRMEQEARADLGALPPFAVGALRLYRRESREERWRPACDVPLGNLL